jgi:hypothetical protein
MQQTSFARPTGALHVQRNVHVPAKALSLREIFRFGLPSFGQDRAVNEWRMKNVPNLLRGLVKVSLARALNLPHFYGQVSLMVQRSDGTRVVLGLASLRVVTTVGVNAIVDAFQNTVELENFKYHGFGTGGSAEAVGNTALTTELTTEYATNNTRPTGTTTEGASANIYRTVGTLSPDATVAITEHGIFDQAANSGGTLLDRTLFSVVNLVSGDSLQVTYDLTFSAGG